MANWGRNVIQILVLGAGLIGARHAKSVQQHPACTLVGVVEPNPALHSDHSISYYTDVADVAHPVQAAIIATPTHLHAEHGIFAAQRGWAILVEKPISESLEQAKALSDAVAKTGVASLVGHHRRYHAHVQHLKHMIAAGDIGDPITATVIWAVRKPDGYFQENWRTTGGSPVMINLVHDVDILRYILGDVTEIRALGSAHIRNADRTESGAALMRFDNGAVAAISFADTAPSPWGFEAGTGENPHIAASHQDMMWITGTAGSVAFPSMTTWSGAQDWSESPKPKRLELPVTNPLAKQLDHFVEVVTRKSTPLISVFDAAETLKVTLQLEAQLSDEINYVKARINKENQHAVR